MNEHIAKTNDLMIIRDLTRYRGIQFVKLAKCFTNDDELALDCRTKPILRSIFRKGTSGRELLDQFGRTPNILQESGGITLRRALAAAG